MATVYSQSFDSLNDGDLNGQDSWSGSTDFDVQTSVKQSGAKGLGNTASGSDTISRSITQTATGTASIYMRVSDITLTDCYFDLYEDGNQKWRVGFNKDTDDIEFLSNDGTDTLDGSPSNNTFYLLEIEFKCGDNEARARVDGGAWTDWRTGYSSGATTGINVLLLGAYSAAAKNKYYDEIVVTDSISGGGIAASKRIVMCN